MADRIDTTSAFAGRRTAPAPLDARFVRASEPVRVTLRQPGKTVRSPDRVIAGALLGVMLVGGRQHHFRVAGDDDVIYLAPPHWLTAESRFEAGIALLDSGGALAALAHLRKWRADIQISAAGDPEGVA